MMILKAMTSHRMLCVSIYRTEVMLAEFKRDSARKELETVMQHVHQRKGELRRIEEEIDEQEEGGK